MVEFAGSCRGRVRFVKKVISTVEGIEVPLPDGTFECQSPRRIYYCYLLYIKGMEYQFIPEKELKLILEK